MPPKSATPDGANKVSVLGESSSTSQEFIASKAVFSHKKVMPAKAVPEGKSVQAIHMNQQRHEAAEKLCDLIPEDSFGRTQGRITSSPAERRASKIEILVNNSGKNGTKNNTARTTLGK